MDILLLPTSDNGPNTGAPGPGGPHWDNVNDDPHDSDASFLQWTSDEPPAAKAGLRIGGVAYYGSSLALSTGYLVTEDAFPVDPSDGAPWSKAKLAATEPIFNADGVLVEAYGWDTSGLAAGDVITTLTLRCAARRRDFGGGVFIRLTELVGLATVDGLPRPTADPSAQDAAATTGNPGSPTATATAVASSATDAAIVGSAAAAAIAAAALAGSGGSPSADETMADPTAAPGAASIPTATVTPVTRSATPASVGPTASAVAVEPSSEAQ
jgi:hypothetical protein